MNRTTQAKQERIHGPNRRKQGETPTRARVFFSYYKPYLGLFILDIFCAVLVAAVSVVIPLLTRYITKDILESGTADMAGRIGRIGLVMLGLTALKAAATYIYDAKGHAMGAKMERDMRRDLMAQYTRLSHRFHKKESSAVRTSLLTNDLLQLAELYHHGPEDIIVYGIKFIASLTILLTINLRLTLVILAFLPVILVYAYFFNRTLGRAYKESLEEIGNVNAQAQETLLGIGEVKGYANETLEQKKFACANNRYLKSRVRIYEQESFYFEGVDVLTQILNIAIVVFGGIAIAGTRLDLADLLSFVLYTGYLMEPIPQIARITQLYQQGISGFNRFMDVMELKSDIADKADARALSDVCGAVTFEDVSFSYEEGDAKVLRGISFHVEPGRQVAVVGTSGVGKTTLLSLVPRFYDVTDGRVLVDGVDVRDVTLASLRAQIGIVQQEVYLFHGTVLENIRYGRPDATEAEVVEAAKQADAHGFIMELAGGYQTVVGQGGQGLSGGQRQRISIARAFLKNPPILLLDEATSALDTLSEQAVQAALHTLAENRTTFIITHRLSAIKNADEILVLREDGIAERGTHNELLALGGLYGQLWGV